MRWFSDIIIALTMLILLVFGAGGVGVMKCDCSGKTSLLTPIERGCCPMDSDCMSVTVLHLSASVMQHNADVPNPQPVTLAVAPAMPKPECRSISVVIPVVPSGRPPTGFVETTVLRV